MGEKREAPRARTSGLVVKVLGDEVLVYDLARHRAHRLNHAAAAVRPGVAPASHTCTNA